MSVESTCDTELCLDAHNSSLHTSTLQRNPRIDVSERPDVVRP
ncbi:hypothetical protein NY08_1007 [Rhodococcus sp. B7740]|nr:hypothetical protein NY08_1007 [Rhodococcus sp. B7740]